MAAPAQHVDALWHWRALISETTDVEFVPQEDGSFLAFGLTEKGSAVVQVYGASYKSHASALDRARTMHAVRTCKVKIDPLPTPPEQIARFRREMEDRFGDDRLVIVKGQTYWMDEEPLDLAEALRWSKRGGPQLGHSGRAFHINFTDGRSLVSHNLWIGHPVPHELAAEFPDNAAFREVPR